MAATVTPSLPFGATEWSTDWSASPGQNQTSWGTWDAPVPAPVPISAKTVKSSMIVPIQPPVALPSAAFVPVDNSAPDAWNPLTAKAPVATVVQSPPVIAPSAFVDASDSSAWTVPAAPEPQSPLVPPLMPLSSPQRTIKLRQAGLNIESELRQQDLYKTEFCRSWRETGACRYGTKCQFAHGEHELRPVLRHPKYKTEVCRNFSETGTCPYGTRCRFVHYQRGRSSNAGLTSLPLPLTPLPMMPTDASVDDVTMQMAALAVVPPPEEAKEKAKGSRLPFFQKLRRNTSADKEKEKESSKGR